MKILTVCIPANNCVPLIEGNVPSHRTTPEIAGSGRSRNSQIYL